MTPYTDVVLRLKPIRPVLEKRDANRITTFKEYAKENGLEVETYGETERPSKHMLSVGTFQPNFDYVTVRNVEVSRVAELRRFGRVLRGYPIRPREFYRQAELRKPVNERPDCPIHRTDKYVHWVSRDHWTCQADHSPQHFGALRLT